MAKYTRRWTENGEPKEVKWEDGINDGREVMISGPPPIRPMGKAPMVMRPFQEYRSTIDGSWISDRGQHREHLKQHGCIELGNEWDAASKLPDMPEPEGVEADIAQAIKEVGGL